jgi:hypothetical protein
MQSFSCHVTVRHCRSHFTINSRLTALFQRLALFYARGGTLDFPIISRRIDTIRGVSRSDSADRVDSHCRSADELPEVTSGGGRPATWSQSINPWQYYAEPGTVSATGSFIIRFFTSLTLLSYGNKIGKWHHHAVCMRECVCLFLTFEQIDWFPQNLVWTKSQNLVLLNFFFHPMFYFFFSSSFFYSPTFSIQTSLSFASVPDYCPFSLLLSLNVLAHKTVASVWKRERIPYAPVLLL